MKNMGKLALAATGLAVAVFAALGMLLPASAVADEEAPGTRGIVIGLGEATPRSDGAWSSMLFAGSRTAPRWRPCPMCGYSPTSRNRRDGLLRRRGPRWVAPPL